MKVLIIVILLDVFIFALGSVFADKEVRLEHTTDRHFHMDRYGYYWKVGE